MVRYLSWYPLPRFQHIPTPLTGLDSEEASGLNDHLANLRDASFMPFRSKSKEVRKKKDRKQKTRKWADEKHGLFYFYFNQSTFQLVPACGLGVSITGSGCLGFTSAPKQSKAKWKRSPFRFFLHEKSSLLCLWSQSFLKWEDDNFSVQNTSVCWVSWDERRWTDRKRFSLLPRNLLGLHLWCLQCGRRLWQWPCGLLDNKRPFRVGVNDLLFYNEKTLFRTKG